ncbi:MAG: DUF1579 family protein [Alphaproteobacteria bacterium]|nr:DUF1579 family protein [Alphaproteobacteria bacterium]
MRRVALLALSLLLAAAAPADAAARLAPPLAGLDQLVGCWRGAFAATTAVHDERCFSPMFEGAFLRDEHAVVGGPAVYRGEAIYRFDPRRQRVEATYYASDGGVEIGRVNLAPGEISFPAAPFIGADGKVLLVRARWRFEGPDRFVSTSEIRKDGRWKPHLHIVYERATSAPALAR